MSQNPLDTNSVPIYKTQEELRSNNIIKSETNKLIISLPDFGNLWRRIRNISFGQILHYHTKLSVYVGIFSGVLLSYNIFRTNYYSEYQSLTWNMTYRFPIFISQRNFLGTTIMFFAGGSLTYFFSPLILLSHMILKYFD
jgi:hypothetical protein